MLGYTRVTKMKTMSCKSVNWS